MRLLGRKMGLTVGIATLLLGSACGDDGGAASGESALGEATQGTPGSQPDGDERTGSSEGAQPTGGEARPGEGDEMPGGGEPTGGDPADEADTPGEADGDGDGDSGGEAADAGERDEGEGLVQARCDLECEAGEHCALQEVRCAREPCAPQPACVPDPQCGGFAGFTCPGSGECVDDPSDDCDPQAGGADCIGLCRCPEEPARQCSGGVWDSSPSVCACVRAVDVGLTCASVLCIEGTRCVEEDGRPRCVPVDGGDGEQPCGDTSCGPGMVCCNASCGICTPPDGACTQQICN